MKRIYLGGPMRSIKNFNREAFARAAADLRGDGHIVFSPPEKDVEMWGKEALESPTGVLADVAHTGVNRRDVIRVDLNWIIDNADAIALLPGWEKSSGARLEKALADFLDLEVIYLGGEEPVRYD
jgi:hypothetical protein